MNSKCGTCKLRKIDRDVRKAWKRSRHMLEWTPSEWVHHRNGGGLPCVTKVITSARCKAFNKLSLSNDICTRTLSSVIQKWKRMLKSKNTPARVQKTLFFTRRFEELGRLTNGRALSTIACQRRPWLWDGTLWGRGGGKQCDAIKITSGTLPTKLNMHRGNTTPDRI